MGRLGWTRRDMVRATMATALVPASAMAIPAEQEPLRAIAASRGMRFGTAVAVPTLRDRPRRALAATQSGIIVAENEFKFGSMRPDARTFQFKPSDTVAAFAKEIGAALRGHNLLWNRSEYLGTWLGTIDLGARPAAALETILVDHVRTVCTRYPQVVSWDVINETIEPATGAIRDTRITQLLGDRGLDLMFAAARRHAPSAELVYNDYMGWNLGEDEHHRAGVLRLLEGFRKRGVPCDALGLQSHISVPADRGAAAIDAAARRWRAFLAEVTGLGYRVLVTEFDVDDRAAPAAIPARDAAVAATGRAYLDETLAVRSCRDILCWGLDSGTSWLQGFVPRPDHLPQRGSPYDAALRPTPLRAAIAEAIRAAPTRA